MAKDIALRVNGVYKNFVLPHEKPNSVKSLFTGAYRRNHDTASKSHEIQHALKDISFEVEKGEFFGIVGRNGSGKSTLLKILAEIYQPSQGTVSRSGRLVPFIELGVGFNPELTGRENVYLNGAMLGFSEKQVDDMYEEIVAFAELERFMDQKLKNYSSGMQVRLAFSMATRADADILLVDEVLAVGDAAFQRKCFEYFKKLKATHKTVVFVTHDMSAVREYCDRAMLIDDSMMKIIGDPQDVSREYSLLFMDEKTRASVTDGKRWGNGDVKADEVVCKHDADSIEVTAKIHVHKNVRQLLYGMHIFGEDGTELTAVNNRMLLVPDIKNLKAGTDQEVIWKILNVFNDGRYSVTLTFVDDVGNTLDWYVGAADFTVRRQERSTTSILPPIKVTNKTLTKGKK